MTGPLESTAGGAASGAQPRVRIDRHDDGVIVLTLDDPDRRNAMSPEMTRSWAQSVAQIRDDESARVAVVTGAGPAFCAGGDTGWLASSPEATIDDLRDRMLPFYRDWLSIRTLEIPTIAAINGPAIGAGLCLALACDLRYAVADAKLSAPFTALGMHPGMAATWLLPEVAGLGLARDMMLTGRVVTGAEAVASGLVNRAFDATSFMEEVEAIAESVATKAPLPTRLTKLALLDGGHATYEAALQWEALAQPITLATRDLQEGLAAARERRRPEFTGR